jgi:Zn-finger nucleic acid-binding protein
MPRCPLCRSALVTITFGLYPIAICTSCGARWIQDGTRQRTINQIQEPSLMAHGPSLMAHGRSQPATQPARSRALTPRSGQLLSGGLPW